jgi:hypothetical protein
LVLDTTGNAQQYVEHIAWNKDSTILAIVLRQEVLINIFFIEISNCHILE